MALPACSPPDPETLLRQALAAYAHRPASDPAIVEAAAQVAEVARHGWGTVTLGFADNQLTRVCPAPDYRFAGRFSPTP